MMSPYPGVRRMLRGGSSLLLLLLLLLCLLLGRADATSLGQLAGKRLAKGGRFGGAFSRMSSSISSLFKPKSTATTTTTTTIAPGTAEAPAPAPPSPSSPSSGGGQSGFHMNDEDPYDTFEAQPIEATSADVVAAEQAGNGPAAANNNNNNGGGGGGGGGGNGTSSGGSGGPGRGATGGSGSGSGSGATGSGSGGGSGNGGGRPTGPLFGNAAALHKGFVMPDPKAPFDYAEASALRKASGDYWQTPVRAGATFDEVDPHANSNSSDPDAGLGDMYTVEPAGGPALHCPEYPTAPKCDCACAKLAWEASERQRGREKGAAFEVMDEKARAAIARMAKEEMKKKLERVRAAAALNVTESAHVDKAAKELAGLKDMLAQSQDKLAKAREALPLAKKAEAEARAKLDDLKTRQEAAQSQVDTLLAVTTTAPGSKDATTIADAAAVLGAHGVVAAPGEHRVQDGELAVCDDDGARPHAAPDMSDRPRLDTAISPEELPTNKKGPS